MAHFGIITPHDAGHALPLCAVGLELVRRGHRVTVVSRPKAATIVQQYGLTFYDTQVEKILRYPGASVLWAVFNQVGQGWIIGHRCGYVGDARMLLQRLPDIFRDLAFDGVVLDQNLIAGGTAAERVGIPFVSVCTATPWHEEPDVPPSFTTWLPRPGWRGRVRNRMAYAGWRWFVHPALKLINHYRRRWQMPPLRHIDDAFSPLTQISQLFPAMDFPHRRLPPIYHYTGGLSVDRPYSDAGFPWEKLDGRPLIFATLGTIADPVNRPVYRKIAAACAGLHAQLVLARGKWTDDEVGREDSYNLPGDPLVVDFAPQLALLDRAILMITHCGMNTTLECISRGVPMVALARCVDQPGNAARMEYAGAGLRASFHKDSPEKIRRVVERVLTEERFRRRAKELQAAMKTAGGAPRAAEICEQAVLSRRPVFRL